MSIMLARTEDSSPAPRRPARERREEMLADWRAGMRQTAIAAKYGISQSLVSKLIGGSPRQKVCDCAEHLSQVAEVEATGSRDFGRGYMHAVRVLAARKLI